MFDMIYSGSCVESWFVPALVGGVFTKGIYLWQLFALEESNNMVKLLSEN